MEHLPRSGRRLRLGDTVRTDVERFSRGAADPDPAAWKEALGLVRGRLFDGLTLTDWAILEGTQAQVESMVVDTALRGAEHALLLGRGEEAEWMIRRALRVCPFDERLYRALLQAAEVMGNRVGMRLAVAELLRVTGDGGAIPAPWRRCSEQAPQVGACSRRGSRKAVGFRPAMARSSSGKSVARAAATGGGASYRGQMPVNWYAALVVIVILGIGSVAWARYDYTKTTTSTTEPMVGQTWHAGLAFDICGTAEPALPASPSSSSGGLTTTGSGVLLIAPKTSAEAGNNATLGKFASEYTGLTLTNSSVQYPGGTEYKNGQTCAAGTPDAGEKGVVRVRSWLLSSKSGRAAASCRRSAGRTPRRRPT